MAITRKRKEEMLAHYTELVRKSEGLILIEYRGLSMKGFDPLRAKIRDASGELRVVKNSLALKALEAAGRPAPASLFGESTAIGFAFSDVPGVAKALTTFAKVSDFVKVKGGLLGDRVLSTQDVTALAELPPLPVVRARLIGLLQTPATRITGAIAGGVRQLLNVVKAYADKEPAAAEPVAA